MFHSGIFLKVVKNIIYVKSGPEATSDVIEAVINRVKESGISSVVVASTKGGSAVRLAENLKGSAEVISVTEFNYSEDLKKRMKKLGVKAIERAELPIQDKREMRETLLLLGTGVKAALEVTTIAAEKGVTQSNVIAIAGSQGGLDTALVVKPAPTSDLFSPDPEKRMAVLEFITLPIRE